MMWLAILVAAAICYATKVAGLSVPDRVLADARMQRIATLLPITLLAALTATQTATTGHRLVADARLPALGVAVVAVLLRAPFIVVVALAVVTAALVRLAT